MTGLSALAEFDLDHFYLRVGRSGFESLGVELPLLVPATKVARANFPNQIATMFLVVHRYGAFACVMGEPADRCASVEGLNRVGTQCAKTHGRYIKQTHVI